jgi:hypothetical protein
VLPSAKVSTIYWYTIMPKVREEIGRDECILSLCPRKYVVLPEEVSRHMN